MEWLSIAHDWPWTLHSCPPFPGKGVRGAGRDGPRAALPAGENFEIYVSSNGLSLHLRHILACLRLEWGHISDLKRGGGCVLMKYFADTIHLFLIVSMHNRESSGGYFLRRHHLSRPLQHENTRCSQAVPHPSTILARRCLTSVIGRERVYSSWYVP